MNTETPQRYEDITGDMIRDWKAKYGKHALFNVSIKLDRSHDDRSGEAEEARFVLRVPDRLTAKAVSQQTDEQKAADLLLNNTVLGGDMAAIEQYAFVWGALVQHATRMIGETGSVIKKL